MDTERKSASGAVVSSTMTTRLSGRWLIVARAVWLALVVPSLGFFVVGLIVTYQQLQWVCVDPVTCSLAGTLTAKELQTLSTSGISVSEYAALLAIFFAITTAIWWAVGFLIFWRRPDDWLALLAAFFLEIFGLGASGNTTYALAHASPVLALPIYLVYYLGYVSLLGFFLVFPNGRLIPRWMGLILLLSILLGFFNYFPSPTSPFDTNWPGWLNLLFVIVVPLGAIIFSQIYRYRRVSTPLQRQQTKWIVLGVTAALGVTLGFFAIPLLIPSSADINNLGEVILVNTLLPVVLLFIPFSIGFSILRYRLYDIDMLINRTLVYGSLTVLLVALYVGLILVSQALVHAVTGSISQQPLILVGSTLVIAALFQPLRRLLQSIIDRRFYRRKYDAAKVVAAFGATLRTEVDVDTLREQLLAVVEETMQPTHVSLWIRPAQQDGKHATAWTGNPSHMGTEE